MKTIIKGTYLCLMEMPRHRTNGNSCLAWYTRPQEEAVSRDYALYCTIKRLVEYNRLRQLFGRVILVYIAPKNQGDKPVACYDVEGKRIW